MSKHHDKQNTRLAFRLALIATLMLGFGYALVPLYNVFCDITGLNGKITGQEAAVSSETQIDANRTVTVQFLTTNNENMPWEFYPMVHSVDVHPGETKKVLFHAKNTTQKTMIAQAIPSVSPGLTAQYFKKTECFCFTQQSLEPGESVEMPVIFMLDTDLPKQHQTVTLSYTLFDAEGFQAPSNKPVGKINF